MKINIKEIIIHILIGLVLIALIGSSCAPKVCPTYYSNEKAKQYKKKSSYEAWTSDFCKVKKKKYKH